ncbi:NAD(P)/FAD-dependent oxidoreductase [Terriglobus saanensis]|uniref:Geranylgeranyl reductase n=1 Tax=Terriglobus saanensis (strain ATCC BAA-1853 / DSM 23119 / SP1PR4) TaxID=401053 RepID=E8V217_TERSS|nr:geranylgeranyl reductase family protein [Terriglobus saanensis]ADV84574.1 geranylgeranyl reductase [Terriglobus saanensis SP1PR4]
MAEFDVIVVGGGPAGATAALRLGQAGVKALLIEKAKAFPREKPCGGGLSSRVLVRFPYLKEVFEEVGVNQIRRVYLESPDGSNAVHEQPEPIMHLVRRWEFDAALFRRAAAVIPVEMGTTVRTLTVKADGVELEATDGRVFTAKMVIGADSANSLIARHAGLRVGEARDEFAVDMMEETPVAEMQAARPDTVSMFLTLTKTFGYGYIFPKKDHVNLGFGCKMDYYLTELRGKGKEHHAGWVDEMKAKGFVSGETQPAGYKAFPIPISGPLARTYADRVLLAGDAGGFVNAFTAEGIVYAMTSGDLAAVAAMQAVKAERFDTAQLASYEKAWKAEIGDDLAHSVDIQKRLFNDSGRIDSLVRAAGRDARLAELFIGYSMGASSYEELRGYMLKSSVPKWVMGRVKSALGFG